MCSDVLAFDDLTKGALAENVKDEIPREKSEGFKAKEGERERTCGRRLSRGSR